MQVFAKGQLRERGTAEGQADSWAPELFQKKPTKMCLQLLWRVRKKRIVETSYSFFCIPPKVLDENDATMASRWQPGTKAGAPGRRAAARLRLAQPVVEPVIRSARVAGGPRRREQ